MYHRETMELVYNAPAYHVHMCTELKSRNFLSAYDSFAQIIHNFILFPVSFYFLHDTCTC